MDITDWFSILGNVATILIGIASIAIAVIAHKHAVRAKEADVRHEAQSRALTQRREAREARDSFLAEYSRWVNHAPDAPKDISALMRLGRSLISRLQSGEIDTAELAATLSLIEGHASSLQDRQFNLAWARPDANESDKEWASGITNGMLDVVKDSVLQDDDGELLDEAFWVKITTPYFDLPPGEVPPLRLPTRVATDAISTWLPGTADVESSRRISALARYKALAEHSLASLLYLEFNDGTGEKSHAEKFVISCRAVMARLVDQMVDQADELIQSISPAHDKDFAAPAGRR